MTRSYSSFKPLRPRKRVGSLESIIIGAFCWKSLSKCPSIIPIVLHNNADFKFRFTIDLSAACSLSSRLLLLLLDFISFILTSTGPEDTQEFLANNYQGSNINITVGYCLWLFRQVMLDKDLIFVILTRSLSITEYTALGLMTLQHHAPEPDTDHWHQQTCLPRAGGNLEPPAYAHQTQVHSAGSLPPVWVTAGKS